MAADVVMPRLSDSMEAGTILSWLKRAGDEVSRGEALVEIETDKANMAYESDVAGTLIELLAEEGETVQVGVVIARIEDGASASGQAARRAGPVRPGPAHPGAHAGLAAGARASSPTTGFAGGAAARSASPAGGRVVASPLARRVARELGIDLAALTGSGPGGRIVKTDVEAAASTLAAPAPAVAPEAAPDAVGRGEARTVEPTRLQRTVARRMSESKATVPHFYLHADVDMSAAVAARARLKALAGDGEAVPSFNDMIVKACALALREHPYANGSYRDGHFELHEQVDVGIAVAADDALIVPTIRDADRKGLREIAVETRRLAARARDGSILPPELSGGTFTVSNLGMFGIASFQAIVNPPQAGILAVGEIVERPVVRDGAIVVSHVMSATLSCDHRILYGADGARFLARIRALLEEPLALAL